MGDDSKNKKIQERVDSEGQYGRWKLRVTGSCVNQGFMSVNLFSSVAAMLRDSVATVVVVRTCPRAIPLAMITMRKSIDGFPFLSHNEYGAPL